MSQLGIDHHRRPIGRKASIPYPTGYHRDLGMLLAVARALAAHDLNGLLRAALPCGRNRNASRIQQAKGIVIFALVNQSLHQIKALPHTSLKLRCSSRSRRQRRFLALVKLIFLLGVVLQDDNTSINMTFDK